MKHIVRSLLVVAVAVAGSMPVQASGAASNSPCDGHGGIKSASARLAGKAFDVTVRCTDGLRHGPLRLPVSGAYPCADNGGVRAATARPGAGVIEIIIYCNDGQSEGPYVYEIR